jgi:hypothetical protein
LPAPADFLHPPGGTRVPAGRLEGIWPALGHAVLPAVIGMVSALSVLTGCSSQTSVSLPPKSSQLSAPSATSPPGPQSAQAAVAAAYAAYFPVLQAAEKVPGSRAEAMLAPYAAQPYLGHVLSQMTSYQAQHEASHGYLVPHVTSVQVSGGRATVHDCQDASHAALADSRTGKVIPGTTGSARTYLIASLARGSDGRWRLTSLAHVNVSCLPGTSSPL